MAQPSFRAWTLHQGLAPLVCSPQFSVLSPRSGRIKQLTSDIWAYGPALNDSISLTQVMSTPQELQRVPWHARLGWGGIYRRGKEIRKSESKLKMPIGTPHRSLLSAGWHTHEQYCTHLMKHDVVKSHVVTVATQDAILRTACVILDYIWASIVRLCWTWLRERWCVPLRAFWNPSDLGSRASSSTAWPCGGVSFQDVFICYQHGDWKDVFTSWDCNVEETTVRNKQEPGNAQHLS